MSNELITSPARQVPLLCFAKRAAWRRWLETNHNIANEAWFVHYKHSANRPTTVSYEEAVEEALCFGWVDGKKKSLDTERYAYRYTPRNPKGLWSAANIARAKRLIEEGRMTAAGLSAFSGHEQRTTSPQPVELPQFLRELFEANHTAWTNFMRFSPSYRKLCTGWVASAKRKETQLRRLNTLVIHSAKNSKIKFM